MLNIQQTASLSPRFLKTILMFIITLMTWINASAEVMVVQPVSVILKQLKMQGYVAISRIELLNGEYAIQGLDSDGKQVAIKVNSHTGEVISMVKKDSYMNMSEAIEKIESLGYSNFSLIQAEGEVYSVIAIAPNGSKNKLTINATTGDLIKETK